MGWDVWNIERGKTTDSEVLDYWQSDERKVLAWNKVRNPYINEVAYFAAIERKDGRVFAGVILARRSNGQIAIKVMDESYGPQVGASERVLNLLSPTDHEWAREWRENCHRHLKGEPLLAYSE